MNAAPAIPRERRSKTEIGADAIAADERYRAPISGIEPRPMGVVAPDTEIEDAMEQMRADGKHLARVVDGSGATLGVLFLEDVLEQLVGEIDDQNQKRGIRRENRSAQ